MSDDPTIIFLHIPKTGGSTLRYLLRRQFGKEALYVPRGAADRKRYLEYLRGEAPPPLPREGRDRNRLHTEALRALPPERLESLRLVMGHLWFGLHDAIPRPCTYITLIRDPVERVLSTYHHRASRHAVGLSLEEYVMTGRDFQLDNNQTRRLAGSTNDVLFTECTPEMLEIAKYNVLQHFAVVGLTERFDETLLLLGAAFGWKRLHYAPQNVSGQRVRKRDLDPQILAKIEELNRYDVELYEFCSRLFNDRLAELGPRAETHMRSLRRRNRLWRRVAPLEPAWTRAKRGGARVKRRARALPRRLASRFRAAVGSRDA